MSGNNKLYRREMAPLTCKRSCTERKLWLGGLSLQGTIQVKDSVKTATSHQSSNPEQNLWVSILSEYKNRKCLSCDDWAFMRLLVAEAVGSHVHVDKDMTTQSSNSAAPSFILLNIDCNFSIRIIYFRMITVRIIYLVGFGQRIFHIW